MVAKNYAAPLRVAQFRDCKFSVFPHLPTSFLRLCRPKAYQQLPNPENQINHTKPYHIIPHYTPRHIVPYHTLLIIAFRNATIRGSAKSFF